MHAPSWKVQKNIRIRSFDKEIVKVLQTKAFFLSLCRPLYLPLPVKEALLLDAYSKLQFHSAVLLS
jgi:hypothetical protein